MTRLVALICAGLLLVGCALGAQISDVSVVGATPTQAVLAYTAPSNNSCTVTVSESPSLTPVVHDLDPTLFANANLDNRPGNVNQGKQRVFVIGKRTAEVALNGKRVSRALQVFTTHFFRISCGSAEATGSFTTANLAPGKAYPEIPLADPGQPGEYSWPDMPYTDSNPQMIDPLTGILFQPLSKPGEKTDYWPSGSQTNHCSSTLSGGGYHCDFGGYFYWINPTTGETRFLGRYGINMYFSVGGDDLGGSSCIADSGTFRPDNPDVFYCPAGAKTGPVILEGTLTGGNVAVGPTGFASISWRNLTPINQGQGLTALAKQFDPSFDPSVLNNLELRGILGDGKLAIDFKTAGQDSPGWLTVFDPAVSQFVAMHFTGTTAIHSYSPVLQSASWVYVTYTGAGRNSMWNYQTDPHGNNIQNDPIDIGHAFVADRIAAGSASQGMNVRTGNNYSAVLASPGKYVANNIATLNEGGIGFENFIEDYTSEGPVSGASALNARPIEAAGNITAITSVSGQLYLAGMLALNTDNTAGSGGMRRKLLPTAAYCGSHPLVDVSGPASAIDDTAADSFKYCVAGAAGECQDSRHTRTTTAGEIYANCPGNDGSTCTGGEGNRGLCVMELGPFSGQISQIDASIPANGLGLDVRSLTWGFVPFRFYGGYFWSARSLPDGSWMLVRSWAYQRSADVNFVAKVPPPFTPDNVARNRFVPVAVSAGAMRGATRAMVRFGYAENGPAQNFYCTSRQEACVASDALGQRSGQIAISGGVATLQSGDPFDADTWKAGTRIQIMGSEWPIAATPTPNTVSVGSQTGTGKVSANGSVVSFSNPGECVKHTLGTHITANGATVTVTNPWQCDGTATGNQVGVNIAVNWSSSAWTWDLGDLGGNTKPYDTTFHYAGEAFNGQPCTNGCTIRIPAISQRVLYYQVVYDNGSTEPVQVVAVP